MQIRRFLLLPVLALLAAACTSEENPPETATVIVEANAENPLLLIVSTRFEVVNTGDLVYNNIDTIPLTGNYNETYQLNSEARFTAILKNDYETVEGVRLSVLLDDRLEYDEIASLGKGGFLQYVYRFRRSGIY